MVQFLCGRKPDPWRSWYVYARAKTSHNILTETGCQTSTVTALSGGVYSIQHATRTWFFSFFKTKFVWNSHFWARLTRSKPFILTWFLKWTTQGAMVDKACSCPRTYFSSHVRTSARLAGPSQPTANANDVVNCVLLPHLVPTVQGRNGQDSVRLTSNSWRMVVSLASSGSSWSRPSV